MKKRINILLIYFVVGLSISCKTNGDNTNHQLKILEVNKKATTNNNISCDNRQKSMTMSCGSGCAFILHEKKVELLKEDEYRIIFRQEMFINEQMSEETIIEYNFICNAKKISRIYNDDKTNYLDENQSTPTQKLSLKQYGESLCGCINK